MNWWAFASMRKDQDRTWLRRSDLLAAIAAAAPTLTTTAATKCVLAAVRIVGTPERRYGHFRYAQEHLDVAVQLAQRKERRPALGRNRR